MMHPKATYHLGQKVQITVGPAQGLGGKVVSHVHNGVEWRYTIELTAGKIAKHVPEHAIQALEPSLNEQELDTILNRLKKLHNKAESAKQLGNEAEANAFMSKVQELLMKHKLEMSEVLHTKRDEQDPMVEDYVDAESYGLQKRAVRMAWIEQLASAIAAAHFCRILVHRGTADVTFIGRRTDVMLAKYVFVTMQRFAHDAADKAYAAYYRQCQRESATYRAKGYRAAWLRGFAMRVTQRYAEETQRFREELKKAGHALIRLDNALAEVNQHIEKSIKTRQVRAVSGKRDQHTDGFRDGVRKANEANLRGTGLGGAAGSSKNLSAGQRQLPGSK